MLLENKTAVVYGAAGPVGAAVARAFAREGARVALVGRTLAGLDAVADRIRADGGHAQCAELDLLDGDAMDAHAADVAAAHGLHVAFNATGNDDVQGTPLLDMAFSDVLRPVTKAVTAQYRIAAAVAPHMAAAGGGAIVCMAGGREAISDLGGSHVAWSALAGLCRQLAAELGPRNIRVAWLLSPGSPDEPAPSTDPDGAPSLLGRRPRYGEVAAAAAFLVSDHAATMTATEVNLTGGLVID